MNGMPTDHPDNPEGDADGVGTVTVLIPTYRRPEKLRRAIGSALSQTYRDIKIVVCDNCSGDDTESVVRSIMAADERVIYFQHSSNMGMNANFNFAISKVSTPYFCLLTDDDYYLPEFLCHAIQPFRELPGGDVRVSIVSAPEVNEAGDLLGDALSEWPKEGRYDAGESIHLVLNGHHPMITACVFSGEVASEVFFDERVGVVSDLPVLIHLLATRPYYVSKRVGLYFIRHADAQGLRPVVPASAFQNRERIEAVVANDDAIEPVLRAEILDGLRHYHNAMLLSLMLRSLANRDEASFSGLTAMIEARRGGFILIAKLVRSMCRSGIGLTIAEVLASCALFVWGRVKRIRRNLTIGQ